MSAEPQEPISGRGYKLRKVTKVTLYRAHMLENVSVGVVDCARVKDVLGASVRVPGSSGKGLKYLLI